MADDDNNKNNPQQNEERLLSVRLNIAHAFVSLWLRAYDALLYHKVNVRDLPEYKDTKLLDEGLAKGDLEQGRNNVLEYIKRVENGISAAVRRKGFRRV